MLEDYKSPNIHETILNISEKINKYKNICKYIHLPVQSGSTRLLQLMNRTYTREWYIAKVNRIFELIPDCGISSDIIAGFCTETEEDHQDTLSIMEHCKYDMSYMYFYSERPGTLAAKRYTDDIPEPIKKRRLPIKKCRISIIVINFTKVPSGKTKQLQIGKVC